MSRCPDSESLTLLLQGRLDDAEFQQAILHVESCESCQSRINEMDSGDRPAESVQPAKDRSHSLSFGDESQLHGAVYQGLQLQQGRKNRGRAAGESRSLNSGAIIGDFLITGQIGQGGMGVVLSARQLSLERDVALKILPATSALDSRQLARFEIEAHAAASLNHPHIIPIHGIGCDSGIHYYAMRLVHGRDLSSLVALVLRHRIETTGEGSGSTGYGSSGSSGVRRTFSASAVDARIDLLVRAGISTETDYIRWVAQLGRQVAEALNAAHEHGVIHRDIKPSNLMIEENGHLWVMDFGLARIDTDVRMTASGDVLGTLRYASPEQALGRRALVDHRTDIYSLGASLYELLAGVPPHDTAEQSALLAQLASEDPSPLRMLNRSVPRDLETVILKCLARDPVVRYATAQSLADDLQRFLNNEPVRAIRPALTDRVVKWSRRHKAIVSTLFTAVLALLVLSAVTLVHNRRLSSVNSQLGLSNANLNRINGNLSNALQTIEQQEAQSRQLLYAADLQLAARALDDNDPRQAIEILQRHEPADLQSDLRHLEWYYLWRQAATENVVISDNDSAVYTLNWSADGRLLASAGEDSVLRIYDSETLNEIAAIATDQGEINGVAFSPDSVLVATTGDDRTLAVWDWKSAVRVSSATVGDDEVWETLFSPDGAQIITTGNDPVPKLWDVSTGEKLGELQGHTAPAGAIAVSHDGRQLASASQDGTVRLWDSDTHESRELVRLTDSDGGPVRLLCVAFSPDDRYVATGGYNRQLTVIDCTSGQVVFRGVHLDRLTSVSFSAVNGLLVSCDRGGNILLWQLPEQTLADGDTVELQPLRVLGGHDGRAYRVRFSPDGQWIASTGSDGKVSLWRAGSGSVWQSVSGLESDVRRLDVSPRGDWCVATAADSLVRMNLGGSGTSTVLLSDVSEFFPVAIDHSGSRVAIVDPAGVIAVVDAESGRVIAERAFQTGVFIWYVDWSADSSLLAVQVGESHRIRVLDSQSLVDVISPTLIEGDRLAFVPNRSFLVAGYERKLRIWDLHQRRLVRTIDHANMSGVSGTAVSDDGVFVACGGADRRVRVWNAGTGHLVHTLNAHRAAVETVAFSQDGSRLYSGSKDGAVVIWQMSTGSKLAELEKCPAGIAGLFPLPDQRSLLVLLDDGRVLTLNSPTASGS